MEFEKEREHVGEGWWPLVDEAHAQLTELLGDYQILQIKEKFGTLRYYIAFPPSPSREISDRAHEIIREAETKSERTCEQCGEPGKTRTSRGWWVTLCDAHYEEREAAMAQRYGELRPENLEES